ncbi:hypothetical protein RJ55_01680 [Drechmeria coniospora]|nr:hypothetical protein RJ55_01680 [Drechmeria coniospora]
MKLTISVLLLGALATSVVATAIPDIGQEADIAEEGVSTLEEKAGLADPARARCRGICGPHGCHCLRPIRVCPCRVVGRPCSCR